MINSNLSSIKWHPDGQILASEASRLQVGAANCNQRGAAQSNVSPLLDLAAGLHPIDQRWMRILVKKDGIVLVWVSCKALVLAGLQV